RVLDLLYRFVGCPGHTPVDCQHCSIIGDCIVHKNSFPLQVSLTICITEPDNFSGGEATQYLI
ncbi:MAG: hypothetical protein OXF60_10585, partial [Gammaproteobacteria bacterium]|nr:hypothetical protein [Gammaproteobacteria bacterium]